MDNYKTIEYKLRNLEPFTGNSLKGFWHGFEYYVWSYETPIAIHSNEKETKWLNPNKYTATTTRHQRLIRKAWAI